MPQVDFNRIATNIAGLNAMNALSDVNSKLGVHRMRLATGKRINEAADDPAGLTIATKFRRRAEGLGQVLANIGDAKNLLAVAEGGLTKISDILVKMETKVIQAASDTLGTDERDAIKSELEQLNAEINAISQETQWNKVKLLYGGIGSSGITLQTGTESNEYTNFKFTGLATFDASSLGINTVEVASYASATAYLDLIKTASGSVSAALQTIGAATARLTFKEENVTIARTNVEAAHNRVMNADLAYEQLEATKLQILQQTAIAMLAQANVAPQNILSLFR